MTVALFWNSMYLSLFVDFVFGDSGIKLSSYLPCVFLSVFVLFFHAFLIVGLCYCLWLRTTFICEFFCVPFHANVALPFSNLS